MKKIKIKIYGLIYSYLKKLSKKLYIIIDNYENEKSNSKFTIVENVLNYYNTKKGLLPSEFKIEKDITPELIVDFDIPDDDETKKIHDYVKSIDKDKWGFTWYNHSGIISNINEIVGLKYRVPTESEFVPGFEYFVFNALEKSWDKKVVTKRQLEDVSDINGELISFFMRFNIRFKLNRNEILVLKDEYKIKNSNGKK